MLAEYRSRAVHVWVFGMLLYLIGAALLVQGGGGVAAVICLAGLVLFVWGFCVYAAGKGHAWALGLLVLLPLLGLLILILMPDKHRSQ